MIYPIIVCFWILFYQLLYLEHKLLIFQWAKIYILNKLEEEIILLEVFKKIIFLNLCVYKGHTPLAITSGISLVSLSGQVWKLPPRLAQVRSHTTLCLDCWKVPLLRRCRAKASYLLHMWQLHALSKLSYCCACSGREEAYWGRCCWEQVTR